MDSTQQTIVKRGVQAVLLDIEGTTSSIRFVYDVMFPFVRQHLKEFLVDNWNSTQVQDTLPLLASDMEFDSVTAWLGSATDVEQRTIVHNAVIEMMDADRKATGLKQLQGLIWKDGFTSGQLVAHLYDDVLPALRQWKSRGIDLRVYSSGSVSAQRLFFGHTEHGDILNLFSAHYDTTIGHKKEPPSYQRIVNDAGVAPESVLFISDVVDELRAADDAGLQTVLSARADNPTQPDHSFDAIERFDQLQLSSD